MYNAWLFITAWKGSYPKFNDVVMHTLICHKFVVIVEVTGASNVPSRYTDIYETECRRRVPLRAEL